MLHKSHTVILISLLACGVLAPQLAAPADAQGWGRRAGAEPQRGRPDAEAQGPRRRRLGPQQDRRNERRGYQEPASARGYADGFQRGLDDGRDRDRYDPVGSRDYRSADQGYYRDYGARDAYRNNYRSGFRQGYEEGYRAGARGRR